MTEEKRLNEDGLILSPHYQETMQTVVLPYLKQRQQDTTVSGDGGKPLFCSFFTADAPKGTAVIVHGFTENGFKFSELIYSLLQNGFNVCAYDQRGHGRSWRDEEITDPSLTHVDDFNAYEHDLKIVCDTMLKNRPRPYVVFAHSMGGAVTSLFLERHSGVFDRAALCAPMIAANRNGIPFFLGKLICRGAKLTGKGKRRIFMSKPYSGPEDFATSCATGKERFDWYDAVKASHTAFQNNGPTYDWTLQSLRVSQMLLKPGAVEKIEIPVRVYGAQEDNSVLPKAQVLFTQRLKNGSRKVIPGSKHEIYRSPDAVLFPWWHEVLEFLKGE
ncbi:MAG: alpha/beta hydrolase [Clostridia bacterium]|nr:alpha/beta hydrolase [Clostridia bacterium]